MRKHTGGFTRQEEKKVYIFATDYPFPWEKKSEVEQQKKLGIPISSLQFSSVARSCPTLCDPMNCSMPGLPVHHQLLEFTQTHVHQVSDAIQPSHPLSSPSHSAFSSVQFSSVTQSCPTHCDPMNRSTPGLPVHHQLPKFTQIHVH